MGKKFSINLFDVDAIRQLQSDLENYRDGLEDKCRELARRLAEKGVEIARIKVTDLDAIDTGELINGIRSEERDYSAFAIVSTAEHSLYVEFGTGYVGKDSPYPYGFPEGITWEYAIGSTIREYMINGRLVMGWWYYDDNHVLHFTEGMPSRPFMAMTAEELRTLIVEIAKEVFTDE